MLEKAMSKEAGIVVFVKSDNNKSQVPSKKTTFLCSFNDLRPGQEEFSFVKMSISQGDKMVVGEILRF